uniref:hypothetical protein n=1 Tax=Mesorhizobium carmichaelinearum TaxID=1208188 RepID=UPI001FCE9A82
IPAYAQQDHGSIKMAAFEHEQLLERRRRCHAPITFPKSLRQNRNAMRIETMATSVVFALLAGSAHAQTSDDPAVTACKSTGLLALQEKSKDINDLVIDIESIAVSKADTKVENVPVKTVILGEAYIARNGKTGAADRFVCLLGEKGKVLLTFFTAQ